jgi:hypothetical protein
MQSREDLIQRQGNQFMVVGLGVDENAPRRGSPEVSEANFHRTLC